MSVLDKGRKGHAVHIGLIYTELGKVCCMLLPFPLIQRSEEDNVGWARNDFSSSGVADTVVVRESTWDFARCSLYYRSIVVVTE